MNRIFILALILLLTACAPERRLDKAPLPVSVHPVAAVAAGAGAQTAQASRYTAVLAPHKLVNLAFKVPGYVEEIASSALDKGGRVKTGQVLARLRDADYKSRLAQARSSLDEANASLALAKSDQERNAKLIQGEVISRSEFDRTQERLGVAQAKSGQSQAAMEQAGINLRDSALASPMDGLVVRRDVECGSLVNQGTVAFVLADLSSVKAVFGMPDQEVARVAVGDSLAVAADALPGREFVGTITAVSPSADPKSRAFDVEVTIPNQNLALKDGMIATVRRDSGRRGIPLAAVPLHALVRPASDTEFVVHVLTETGGKAYAKARTITVGGVAGDMVTVLAGLVPGEQVITRGTTLASDGQEVRVIR